MLFPKKGGGKKRFCLSLSHVTFFFFFLSLLGHHSNRVNNKYFTHAWVYQLYDYGISLRFENTLQKILL